jgi:hypothetical protein
MAFEELIEPLDERTITFAPWSESTLDEARTDSVVVESSQPSRDRWVGSNASRARRDQLSNLRADFIGVPLVPHADDAPLSV